MKFSTITDTVLTKTTLMAKKEPVAGASIFPFFNTSGQVEQLMVVLPDANIVFMIPFKKGLATVSFLGVVSLSMDLAQIESYSNFTVNQIEDLYHYDPNWQLSHERFAGYWARNLLQQSNCTDRLDKKVRNLMFAKDLSSLDHFAMKSFGLNLFRSIPPEILLATLHPIQTETCDSVGPPNPGWQLNPIWKYWHYS